MASLFDSLTLSHGSALKNRFVLAPITNLQSHPNGVDGVRAACRTDFTLGVRLSPERFGVNLADVRHVAERLMCEGRIDFLDLSLWDVFKLPEEEAFKTRSLLSWFTDLDRGSVRLGAAGKIAAHHRRLPAGGRPERRGCPVHEELERLRREAA